MSDEQLRESLSQPAPFYALWPPPLVLALMAEGVRTLEDLAAVPISTLLCHKGVGSDGLRRCREELSAHGLSFKPVEFRPRSRAALTAVPDVSGVYFVRALGLVKIGYTRNIRHRVKNAQTFVPFPLELAHYVPCTDDMDARTTEATFHERFKAYRSLGEWFHEEGSLREFLAECERAHHGR